jgi:hypothetical protein
MPEVILQLPSYSILYGFREGAQHDIFVNSNPRRHVTERSPAEKMCNGKRSRTVEPAGWTDLTSPNCSCTAKRQSNGDVQIFDGNIPISTIDIGGASGALDLVKNNDFKAGGRYFPLGEGPYTMELNNKCYLFVSDANGVVVWESMFDSGFQQKYVVGTFTGMSPDPSEWPVYGTIYAQMPTTTTPPSLSPTKSPSRSPSAWPRTRTPTARPMTQNPTNEGLFDLSLTATHIAARAIGNATTTIVPTPTTTPTDTPVTTHTPRGGHGLR